MREKDIDELGDDILQLLNEIDGQPTQQPVTPPPKLTNTISEEEKQMNYLLN